MKMSNFTAKAAEIARNCTPPHLLSVCEEGKKPPPSSFTPQKNCTLLRLG